MLENTILSKGRFGPKTSEWLVDTKKNLMYSNEWLSLELKEKLLLQSTKLEHQAGIGSFVEKYYFSLEICEEYVRRERRCGLLSHFISAQKQAHGGTYGVVVSQQLNDLRRKLKDSEVAANEPRITWISMPNHSARTIFAFCGEIDDYWDAMLGIKTCPQNVKLKWLSSQPSLEWVSWLVDTVGDDVHVWELVFSLLGDEERTLNEVVDLANSVMQS